MQAINTATGLRRETETSTLGSYVLQYMETGTFHIEISKDSFAPLRFRNVKLEVGHPRTLDVTLSIAGHREEMSITEARFQLDRVDATVGASIEQKQVDELPDQRQKLVDSHRARSRRGRRGRRRPAHDPLCSHGLDDNNLTLDGVDAAAVFNQMQREYVKLTIPLESIDQFDVKDQTFGADVEVSGAAQVARTSLNGTVTDEQGESRGPVFLRWSRGSG